MINLTPSEWAIIEHRLCLWDCLAECISENDDNECTYEQVYEAAWLLNKSLKENKTIDFSSLNKLQILILVDCLEGSTYFGSGEDAVASGEISKGTWLSQIRAAQSLEKKFKQAGYIVSIPLR